MLFLNNYRNQSILKKFIAFLFLVNINISAQPETGNFLKAIIVLDSNRVFVEENNKTIANLNPEIGWYFENFIKYDELTGFISLIENQSISENRWIYKVIVWNYLNNKKYTVLSGESGTGEMFHRAKIVNYNPEKKSCLINHYGWEWSWVSKYDNGSEKSIRNTEIYDIVNLLAVLDEDLILIKATILGENSKYFLYSWGTKMLKYLNESEVITYNQNIIKTTGENFLYLDRSPFAEEIYYDEILWSPYKNALVFTSLNKGYSDLFLYDISNRTKLKLKSGHINYAVIWED